MTRGTTPTIILTIKNINLLGYKIEVDIRQKNKVLIKTDAEVQYNAPDTILSIFLSQKDTLEFLADVLTEIQVRFIDSNGIAGATNILELPINRILREGTIEYGS